MHLHSVLRGAHAYLSPTASLAGLGADHAAQRLANSAHSIAEIVAHMAFWQNWFLDRCDGVCSPAPAQAALGWPAVNVGDWERVLRQFEEGFKRALTTAEDSARSAQLVSPPIEFDHLAQYTIGDALIHLALHNAHHVGQVVTLRQQLGAWPPPAGSWTW